KKMFLTVFVLFCFYIYSQDLIYKSATEYDYPPFSVTDKGIADGFSVELLKAVCDEMKIKVSFKIDDWETIKNELKDGKLDILPLVGRTPEREAYFDFTIPYITLNGSIFVRKDNKTIRSEEDLYGKEIIVMEGDNAHEYAKRNNFTNKIVLTKTYIDAFKLLSSGKHDAILAQTIVGMKIISDLKLKNVKSLTGASKNNLSPSRINLSGFEQKFCFAVKEGDKNLLAMLNEGLVIVSENGKYKKIFEKWFPFLRDNSIPLNNFIIYLVSILIPTILIILLILIVYFRNAVKKKTKDLITEIAEKCKIEDELKNSEEKYKLIAENTAECIWILDLKNRRYKYISPSIYNLRGLTVSEALNEKMEDSLTPQSYKKVNELIAKRLEKFIRAENGESNENYKGYIDEFQQYRKDGSIIDVEISTKFVWNEESQFYDVVGVSRDITDRKKIMAKNIYHRNLLEVSLDPLVTIGPDGKITDVNLATINATGCTSQELIGTDFSDYFTDPEKAKEGYKTVFEKGVVHDYILELKHKNGSKMTVAYNASVYKNENNEIIGVFAAARDITEKKKLELELEQYHQHLEEVVKLRTSQLQKTNIELLEEKERAEKASKAKSEFLSNMSHELRTPLNGIIGFSEVLFEEESDTQKKEYLSIVLESGKHLLTIINNILDISKIESEMMKLNHEKMNLNTIINWIKENFKIDFKKRNNEFIVNNNIKSEEFISDELRLKQILTNLIGNANKFTENGKITLELSEESNNENNVNITFKIKDTGIGISEDKMKHLFEMFNQGEHHLTKKYGGTGIGLAIVKKLVNLMNGEIFVTSEIGKGTTFEIKIPLDLSIKTNLKKENEENHEDIVNFSNYKILIAEDSIINIKFLEMLLIDTQIKYDIVTDGEQVLEKLKHERYDLILMDSQMPNLNGLDATKIIRGMENTDISKLPIITLSAYALNEDVEKAFSYGIDDYLSKPFTKNELYNVLKKWLGKKE
ncbi:MAG TPA: transporter substrate-binding domain-containing protein, partial [Spirochaetota bacterium]|nr:transporter substrate-binding domain-containing protein [Spirochaetota bacterium]